LTDIYRSPLFKDLLYLNNPPVISIKKKRELLVVELFTSKVEVGDIPFNIFTVIIHYIDFSSIIAKNVYKTIIETGNTTPDINEVLITIL